MNLRNFQFAEEHIGIDVGGIYIDLHNNYDFVELSEDPGKVCLLWKRLDERRVAAGSPETVLLTFDRASVVAKRGKPSRDIMEFGFFENELDVPYQGLHAPAPGVEVFVVRFESGAEIAVRAESAGASVGGDV
jgi:hypothetical protein